MRVLLDTRILLWWLADDPLLPTKAETVMRDESTEIVVSAATVWEIEIKRAAGRLDAPDDLPAAMAASTMATLPITAAHAVRAARLPAHHADPFDRMLIAQAQTEGLTLVSVDDRFPAYEVDLLLLN